MDVRTLPKYKRPESCLRAMNSWTAQVGKFDVGDVGICTALNQSIGARFSTSRSFISMKKPVYRGHAVYAYVIY